MLDLRSRRALSTQKREASGHAKALKLIESAFREVSERAINGHLVGRRLPELRKPFPVSFGKLASTVDSDLLENVELSPNRKAPQKDYLLQEFEDVFSRNSSDIGHTTVTQHRIDTADHPPIKQQSPDACRLLNRKRILRPGSQMDTTAQRVLLDIRHRKGSSHGNADALQEDHAQKIVVIVPE
ncbi:hypothetical protein TNCV_3988621 [Trichonephila clavipes]|nr:hypothetical protein TNCV_3988621 [Trichonephila clavipes]